MLNVAETAKVADFGLSLRTRGPVTKRVVDNLLAPIWLAPELLSNQPYSVLVQFKLNILFTLALNKNFQSI